MTMMVKLYFVQIVHGESFVTFAERQYINRNTISYDRGEIYFQSKAGENIPAAISRSGFTSPMNPSIIKDPESIYRQVNPIIPLDKADFLARASKINDKNEEIAKNINSDTANKIKALNIYGINIATDKWRFYPGNSLAAQSIGFVAYKDDVLAMAVCQNDRLPLSV
jgi:cell division protein FtsI/penicillin-binding protein 2